MPPRIPLVCEHNPKSVLLYFEAHPGAYARGPGEAEALAKAPEELGRYLRWAGLPPAPGAAFYIRTRIAAHAGLAIDDADSEALLPGEDAPLEDAAFARLCALAQRSAQDFEALYRSIPDKEWVQPEKLRPTFHRKTPATATEMLLHTDSVGSYYLSCIGLAAACTPGRIAENRAACLRALAEGRTRLFRLFEANGERWSEAKVLRRLLWHDRIHARALYRHGLKCGAAPAALADPFFFGT